MSLYGCVSEISYKYYVLDFENQTLNGPSSEYDLPLNRCMKVNDEYQCAVVFLDELAKIKRDTATMRPL